MGALFSVAIVAAASMAALRYSAATQQREKEAWLLFVGKEYRLALERYAATAAGAPARGPRELEDLLVDRRGSTPLHHLRRLYADPMTGRADWVLLRDNDGLIIGLHSSSRRQPFRRQGFDANEQSFSKALSYRDWVFRPSADLGHSMGQNPADSDAVQASIGPAPGFSP